MINPGKNHASAYTLLEVAMVLAGASLLTTATAQAAFTLVELCLVLVIVTLLGSVVLTKMTQDTRITKASNLQNKLDKIEHALQNYAKQNNRLPCPADGRLKKESDANFGLEVSAPGSCTNSSTYTSGNSPSNPNSANFYDGTDTVGGVIPVRTLASYGLVADDIFDEWNNQIGYFVSKKATETNALTTYRNTPIGNITVKDGSGNNRTESAVSLVLSYGSAGHGAFQINGVRKVANINNLDVIENCSCNSDGTLRTFDNTFVLHPSNQTTANDPSTLFDDTGRYMQLEYYLVLGSSAAPTPTPTGAPTPTITPTPTPTPTPTSTCFPGGVEISTPMGGVPIEHILVGDNVLTIDNLGNVATHPVTHVFIHPDIKTLDVNTDSGTIRTTSEHPMWMGGDIYRPAGSLKPGDKIMRYIDGVVGATTVSNLEYDRSVETVYNIEVDNTHTYIADGFIVHNKNWATD